MYVQEISFDDIISAVRDNKSIPKTIPASIRKLCPFMDIEDLLRVGGRIKPSSLNYEAKHPIMLTANSYYHLINF